MFTEKGKYVFVDSAVPEWSMVVVVSEEGTECDTRSSIFQPMISAQLVKHGIVKQHRLNLLPDWGMIAGLHPCWLICISFCRRIAVLNSSLLWLHLTLCRCVESTAGCCYGRNNHSAGSASRKSKACLPVED